MQSCNDSMQSCNDSTHSCNNLCHSHRHRHRHRQQKHRRRGPPEVLRHRQQKPPEVLRHCQQTQSGRRPSSQTSRHRGQHGHRSQSQVRWHQRRFLHKWPPPRYQRSLHKRYGLQILCRLAAGFGEMHTNTKMSGAGCAIVGGTKLTTTVTDTCGNSVTIILNVINILTNDSAVEAMTFSSCTACFFVLIES